MNQLIESVYLFGKKQATALDSDQAVKMIEQQVLAEPSADNKTSAEKCLWIHLHFEHPDAGNWLHELNRKFGDDVLPLHVIDALINESSRPRSVAQPNGIYLSLRGLNLQEDNDPEDMISIRLWVRKGLIISAFRRPLKSINDIAKRLQENSGPADAPGWLLLLVQRLTTRMQQHLYALDEQLNDWEDVMLEDEVTDNEELEVTPEQLSSMKKKIIELRRYLLPQAEAIMDLYEDNAPFFSKNQRAQLPEAYDKVRRQIELMAAITERINVLQDMHIHRMSEQMNKRMYSMSIITVLFLPLSFLTGLLGINVAGMPGADNQKAFMIVIIVVLIAFIGQMLYLKWKNWF